MLSTVASAGILNNSCPDSSHELLGHGSGEQIKPNPPDDSQESLGGGSSEQYKASAVKCAYLNSIDGVPTEPIVPCLGIEDSNINSIKMDTIDIRGGCDTATTAVILICARMRSVVILVNIQSSKDNTRIRLEIKREKWIANTISIPMSIQHLEELYIKDIGVERN
jgi:hypothetical protein